MAQFRFWCFTLNNPEFLIDFYNVPNVRYAIYSEECGASGNYHFQGYIQMVRAVRLAAMIKIIPGAHFEPQRAPDSDAARAYCAKTGDPTFIAGPYEYGEYVKTGQRTDLLAIKKKLDAGISEKDLAHTEFCAWVRYHKSFERYQQLISKKRDSIDKVIVLYGAPGLGKTYWCTDFFKDIYWTARPNNGAFYFENYHGETTMLIDDFYGYYPRDFMLRLCQPYECRLPYRGGEVECLATTILITSNKPPWMWWKTGDISNFARRVTHWMYFTDFKTYTETSDYNVFRAAVEKDLFKRPTSDPIQ